MGIPRPKKIRRRKDWEIHHVHVRKVFMDLYKMKVKEGDFCPPSIRELAEVSGLSEQTITKHLDELDLQKVMCGSSLSLMIEPIMGRLGMKCLMEGDPKAVEVFMKYFDFAEKQTKIDLTSKGEKIQQQSGDVFQIIVPEWQKEVEEFTKNLKDGTARPREVEVNEHSGGSSIKASEAGT